MSIKVISCSENGDLSPIWIWEFLLIIYFERSDQLITKNIEINDIVPAFKKPRATEQEGKDYINRASQ